MCILTLRAQPVIVDRPRHESQRHAGKAEAHGQVHRHTAYNRDGRSDRRVCVRQHHERVLRDCMERGASEMALSGNSCSAPDQHSAGFAGINHFKTDDIVPNARQFINLVAVYERSI